jgi:hypothetical protein
MKLTEHFLLEEFLQNNHNLILQPSTKEIENITTLCEKVLEPLREKFCVPIKISSGYRNYVLNGLVKGSVNSDHLFGYAADFQTDKPFDLIKMYSWIIRALNFNQVIFYVMDDLKCRWVHVSYKPRQNVREILISELGIKYRLECWLRDILHIG